MGSQAVGVSGWRTKEERPGSPLIMLEAMDRAEDEAQQRRSKPFHLDVHYIFVEKSRNALNYLRLVLADSKYAPLVGDKIQLIEGEFTSQVPEIIEFVKKRGRSGRAPSSFSISLATALYRSRPFGPFSRRS